MGLRAVAVTTPVTFTWSVMEHNPTTAGAVKFYENNKRDCMKSVS